MVLSNHMKNIYTIVRINTMKSPAFLPNDSFTQKDTFVELDFMYIMAYGDIRVKLCAYVCAYLWCVVCLHSSSKVDMKLRRSVKGTAPQEE